MKSRAPEQRLSTSSLSRRVLHEGLEVDLYIYRLEVDEQWRLEVVCNTGASFLWDEPFSTEEAANEDFLEAVSRHGLSVFHDGGNVVPFRR